MDWIESSFICLFIQVLPAGSNSHYVFLCSNDDGDLYTSFDYVMHNNTSRFLQGKNRRLLFSWRIQWITVMCIGRKRARTVFNRNSPAEGFEILALRLLWWMKFESLTFGTSRWLEPSEVFAIISVDFLQNYPVRCHIGPISGLSFFGFDSCSSSLVEYAQK